MDIILVLKSMLVEELENQIMVANLLLTEDPEIAFKISKELTNLNEKRKSIENIILEEAIILQSSKIITHYCC